MLFFEKIDIFLVHIKYAFMAKHAGNYMIKLTYFLFIDMSKEIATISSIRQYRTFKTYIVKFNIHLRSPIWPLLN